MAILVTGKTWTNEQITPAGLNETANSATFAAGAVDGSTTALSGGAIIVKDLGVTDAKLASNAVTTGKINDASVTSAKLAASISFAGKTLAFDAGQILTASIADDAITYAKVDTATQAEMEGESAAGVATPDFLKYHPGIAKAYGKVEFSSGNNSGGSDQYNVTSVSGTGTTRTVNLAVTMSGTDYQVVVTTQNTSTTSNSPGYNITSATSFSIFQNENSGQEMSFVVYGTLA